MKLYGIYRTDQKSVFVFQGNWHYIRAYYFDKAEAEEICAKMNLQSDKYKYEVMEV